MRMMVFWPLIFISNDYTGTNVLRPRNWRRDLNCTHLFLWGSGQPVLQLSLSLCQALRQSLNGGIAVVKVTLHLIEQRL